MPHYKRTAAQCWSHWTAIVRGRAALRCPARYFTLIFTVTVLLAARYLLVPATFTFTLTL